MYDRLLIRASSTCSLTSQLIVLRSRLIIGHGRWLSLFGYTLAIAEVSGDVSKTFDKECLNGMLKTCQRPFGDLGLC